MASPAAALFKNENYSILLNENFVTIKRNEKIYIQFSDDISTDNTLKREVTPLVVIKDVYNDESACCQE